MKGTATRIRLAVAVLGLMAGGAGRARADLTLTAAGVAQGFTLSTFASGFRNSSNIGPMGIAFPVSGGVLVSDYLGNVRLFPTDKDGQALPAAAYNYGFQKAVGLATSGGKVYMTLMATGEIGQINDDGTPNHRVVGGISETTGIVTNPTNGHLLVSTLNENAVVDINPITGSFTTVLKNVPRPDGEAISADGSILYVAATTDGGSGHVLGYSLSTKTLVFDSGAFSQDIDGIALGYGSLAGDLFVNTNGGTVVEVDTKTKSQTVIASGGSRGDFVTVDPNNGSLLLTQTDSILRLTPKSGGGFAPLSATEPSTLLPASIVGLMGLGQAWRRRRTRRVA